MIVSPDSREIQTSRLAFRCGLVFLIFSALLWIVTTVCFIGLWDHVAALTTFPQWSWAIPGILSVAVAWRLMRGGRRWLLLLLALWIAAIVLFADNLGSLLRSIGLGAGYSVQFFPRGTFQQTFPPRAAPKCVDAQ